MKGAARHPALAITLRPRRCASGGSAPTGRGFAVLFACALVLAPALLRAGEPSPIALLSALDAEAQPVLAVVTDREAVTVLGLPCVAGKLGGRRVVVAATGVGKVNAAMTTALLVERFSPAAVIFTGVAGALDAGLHPGDVVVGETLVQHDLVRHTEEGVVLRSVRSPRDGSANPLALEPAPRLLALAREAAAAVEPRLAGVEGGARPPRLVFGTIATGDTFVGSRARKTELRDRLSAHAVEMEGAAVAQVCRELGVPFLVVRGLSDRASGGASAEARRNLGVAARNAAEVALAVARRLGLEGP